MLDERRTTKRRLCWHYLGVTDNDTHELLGYLSDISLGGFRIESQKALTINKTFYLRLDSIPEISNAGYISVFAKSVWGQPDPFSPNEYSEGFQIVNILPNEQKIYQRIVEEYTMPENNS